MITCKLCQRHFRKITNSHLRDKHSTTLEEYLNQFPDAPTMTEELRMSYGAHARGRSYEEQYGVEIAKALRENRRVDAFRQYEDIKQKELRSNYRYKGYEELSGTKWSSYKKGAELRGLPFEILIEDTWELFLQQERKCAISGVPIYFDMDIKNLSRTSNQGGTASLDRIDSKQGYVVGNVQWVHKHINKMKMDLPEQDFFSMVKQIYEYKQLKNK